MISPGTIKRIYAALPPTWTLVRTDRGRYEIRTPCGRTTALTLDGSRGFTVNGVLRKDAKYIGRDWATRLAADAVAWLHSQMPVDATAEAIACFLEHELSIYPPFDSVHPWAKRRIADIRAGRWHAWRR